MKMKVVFAFFTCAFMATAISQKLDSKVLISDKTNGKIITELQYTHVVGLTNNHRLWATGFLISLKHVLSPINFINNLKEAGTDYSSYSVYVPPLTEDEKSAYYGIEDFAVDAAGEYGVLLLNDDCHYGKMRIRPCPITGVVSEKTEAYAINMVWDPLYAKIPIVKIKAVIYPDQMCNSIYSHLNLEIKNYVCAIMDTEQDIARGGVVLVDKNEVAIGMQIIIARGVNDPSLYMKIGAHYSEYSRLQEILDNKHPNMPEIALPKWRRDSNDNGDQVGPLYTLSKCYRDGTLEWEEVKPDHIN